MSALSGKQKSRFFGNLSEKSADLAYFALPKPRNFVKNPSDRVIFYWMRILFSQHFSPGSMWTGVFRLQSGMAGPSGSVPALNPPFAHV
jgi:hypothetical protein